MGSGHWVLIANPQAGNGRGRMIAKRALTCLENAGQAVDLHFTREKGHGTELAHQAVAAGAERRIVCGGDGTISETLPALADSAIPLGLLPFGTANDFARALDIPRKVNPAIHTLLQGQVCPIDLGRARNRLFTTVAAFGFDAEISHRMSNGQVPFSGTAGYLFETWRHTATYRPVPVLLLGDFGTIHQEVLQVSTANTRSYGGGIQIAPGARADDGLFDLIIIDSVPRWTILSVLPRLFSGKHIAHPAVRIERTSQLELHTDEPRVMHADGEYLGETPMNLQVCPEALMVVLPAKA